MRTAEEIKKRLIPLVQKYELTLVVLFGSQATGITHADSDVDIAFASAKPLLGSLETELNYELTTLVGSDRVDSVNVRDADPILLKEIVDGGVVLYDRSGLSFAVLEAYAVQRYAEASPLFIMRKEKLDSFRSLHIA